MKIKTVCEVQVYEESDMTNLSDERVIVRSHWNIGRWVEIEVKGKRVFVDGYEMRDAILKAVNQ